MSDVFAVMTVQFANRQGITTVATNRLAMSDVSGMLPSEVFQLAFKQTTDTFGAPASLTSVLFYYAAEERAVML